QLDVRHRAVLRQVRKHSPRPDARQQVEVAYKDESAIIRKRLQQSVEQPDIKHRGFITHNDAAAEAITCVASESEFASARINSSLKEAMHGSRGLSGCFFESLCGFTSRSTVRDLDIWLDSANERTSVVFPVPGEPSRQKMLACWMAVSAATWSSARPLNNIGKSRGAGRESIALTR